MKPNFNPPPHPVLCVNTITYFFFFIWLICSRCVEVIHCMPLQHGVLHLLQWEASLPCHVSNVGMIPCEHSKHLWCTHLSSHTLKLWAKHELFVTDLTVFYDCFPLLHRVQSSWLECGWVEMGWFMELKTESWQTMPWIWSIVLILSPTLTLHNRTSVSFQLTLITLCCSQVDAQGVWNKRTKWMVVC